MVNVSNEEEMMIAYILTCGALLMMLTEVLVFHILDPAEVLFPYKKDTLFKDMETNERLNIDAKTVRTSYREKIHRFINAYKKDFRNVSIDYQFLRTDTPYDKALFSYLKKRKRMK